MTPGGWWRSVTGMEHYATVIGYDLYSGGDGHLYVRVEQVAQHHSFEKVVRELLAAVLDFHDDPDEIPA